MLTFLDKVFRFVVIGSKQSRTLSKRERRARRRRWFGWSSDVGNVQHALVHDLALLDNFRLRDEVEEGVALLVFEGAQPWQDWHLAHGTIKLACDRVDLTLLLSGRARVEHGKQLALDVGEAARGGAVLVDATWEVAEAREAREGGDDGGDDGAGHGEDLVDHERTRDEGGQQQYEETQAEALRI